MVLPHRGGRGNWKRGRRPGNMGYSSNYARNTLVPFTNADGVRSLVRCACDRRAFFTSSERPDRPPRHSIAGCGGSCATRPQCLACANSRSAFRSDAGMVSRLGSRTNRRSHCKGRPCVERVGGRLERIRSTARNQICQQRWRRVCQCALGNRDACGESWFVSPRATRQIDP